MRCAICVVIGNPPEGPMMPHLVTYRGYSLCDEHLQMWEYQHEADWRKIVAVASEPTVEEMHQILTEDATDIQLQSEYDAVHVPQMDSDYSVGDKTWLANHKVVDDNSDVGFATPNEPPVVPTPAEYLSGEDEMLGRAMDANDPPSIPQVTMFEEKKAEFKSKRRRRKKTYHCTKCDKKHSRKSNIGKEHWGHADI
jgi:hypothetical protein